MVDELFFCQISLNSNDWIVRNWQVCAKPTGLNFSSNCACAAGFWVLSIWKNSRIVGFLASLSFLTYLCCKRLKPSKNSKDRVCTERTKWSLYHQLVCFAIIVHALNRISKSTHENCVGHLNQWLCTTLVYLTCN